MRTLKFSEAIREATAQAMTCDEGVYVMGLGVPDPKGIFGTTLGLQEQFGKSRVFDMPTSENAMMGVAIGSAINGLKPILTHQRVDFFLLALDQLINNAAKWRYMFAEQMQVPLVIRLMIGRGWGQGPQHAQSLHSLFAHIPGLKVVAPSNAHDAKGLLLSAIEDSGPVIFLEHRWLHGLFGEVPEAMYQVPIGQGKLLSSGKDLTIVASSHATLEAWKGTLLLKTEGIEVDLIDLRSLRPLDENLIFESVRKTGRLLVVDEDWKFCGFSAEVIASVTENLWHELKAPPQRMTYPDTMTPTSWRLANFFYPGEKNIAAMAFRMMGHIEKAVQLEAKDNWERQQGPLDVPDREFTGPF